MMINRNYTIGDEIRFSGSRSPYIDQERIKQLRIYKDETEKIISRLKKIGEPASIKMNAEKQLVISIKNEIQALTEKSLRSEFNQYDYFPKCVL